MPWTRLDDGFHSNPKILGLSHEAFRLYVNALTWSVSQLQDGAVMPAVVGMSLPHTSHRSQKRAVDELVQTGLWIDNGKGWRIHDFHDYQETKEEVDERRKRWADRQALARNAPIKVAIRQRDQDHCRYCDDPVDWSDRTGPKSGTLDHIDPQGPSSIDNLATACRTCNNRKRRRTPVEASMKLLSPRSERGQPGDMGGDIAVSQRAPIPIPINPPLDAHAEGLTTPREALRAWAILQDTRPTEPWIKTRLTKAEAFLEQHPDLSRTELTTFLKWAKNNGCAEPGGWPSWWPAWPKQPAAKEIPHCEICDDRRLVPLDDDWKMMAPCVCIQVNR